MAWHWCRVSGIVCGMVLLICCGMLSYAIRYRPISVRSCSSTGGQQIGLFLAREYISLQRDGCLVLCPVGSKVVKSNLERVHSMLPCSVVFHWPISQKCSIIHIDYALLRDRIEALTCAIISTRQAFPARVLTFSPTRTKAMFTLGARALVPGHRHKMVLCSDTGHPRYNTTL